MSFTSSILITGGTTGLGYETALSLAKSQPTTQIIIASRSNGSAADTINSLTSNDPPNVVYLPLDLETHASTREFVKLYESRSFPPIRALLLNAGIQFVDKVHFTSDGIETMFAVNHVNQALLFFLLKKYLTTTARIVIVSSSTHDPAQKRVVPPNYTTAEAVAHPPSGKPEYETQDEGFRRYALSKLTNVLFAYALTRHVKENNKAWKVLTLDPGVMPTRLYRWQSGFTGWAFNFVLSTFIGQWLIRDTFTTAFSAATFARLAVDEEFEAEDKNGKYFQVVGGKEIASSEQSYEVKLQEDLWDWTVKEVAEGKEVEDFNAL
ncbi:hypothetical protein CI109_103218 [Kwoniella shandongensis]|uniref:Uncharacterized protein n=1 Tax=Kwoniella shandongensis TaxID=1734106 RepID=A0A5M6CDN6_9TREE|nr:uncharacterized protein CI109_000408 [Kwoniella shandongensis]KAA5531565.1 hypothetical protein CI109_000408 [Kwoniella shandongensis]